MSEILPLHLVQLSPRLDRILKYEKMLDFAHLQNFTANDLLKIRGIGKHCINEIRAKLDFYGLSLKGEESLYRSSDTILNSLPRMLEDLHYYIFNLKDELITFELRIKQIESFLKNVKQEKHDTDSTRQLDTNFPTDF